MSKVELHCAYQWDCDECGRENFVRAVVMEMTEEDVQVLMGKYGGEPEDWQTGQWMTRPDEVACQHCGAEFETEDTDAPKRD